MIRNTIGILMMVLFLAAIGFAPAASAQVVSTSVVTEPGKIRLPDLPDKQVKWNPGFDFVGLRMNQNPPRHATTQVGPVEFESRPITVDAPWQPYQEPYQPWTPFFERAHTDFSWQFYLHWKPQ